MILNSNLQGGQRYRLAIALQDDALLQVLVSPVAIVSESPLDQDGPRFPIVSQQEDNGPMELACSGLSGHYGRQTDLEAIGGLRSQNYTSFHFCTYMVVGDPSGQTLAFLTMI